jgi:hypothetical protein
MEQSPSSEAIQEILRLLWKKNIHSQELDNGPYPEPEELNSQHHVTSFRTI